MEKYTGKTQIQLWTEEHFYVFDANIRQMEDQIFWFREEKSDTLAPSSFSYYLYRRKVEEFRRELEFLLDECGELDLDRLEKHIRERIIELLKQDEINLEDYPENEILLEIKEIHEKYCREWMECLYFNAEIPE